MGQPTMSNVIVSMSESIAHEKGTRGTETSKYPEEEKETSIFLVAASERERVQTSFYWGCGSCKGYMMYSQTARTGRPERVKAP